VTTPDLTQNYQKLTQAVSECARAANHPVSLLAVTKTWPAATVRDCAALGQRAFGENYVQEAIGKIDELAGSGLQWHLIGPLQSNKCQAVAERFDWVQTVDREKIVALLSKHRPARLPPLNVLIQVNIDDEDSKSGCAPEAIGALASCIAAMPNLRLRGLMAIPKPTRNQDGTAFKAMARLYKTLQDAFTGIDTLSMGMSDDFPLAIQHGANLIRVGSALFGARAPKAET
jgi:hypothetical protein